MTIQENADKLVGDANTVVEGAVAMKSAITEFGVEKYNEGFQAGKDSIQLPDTGNPDNIYTQAQMNDAVTAGKAQQRSEDELEFGARISEMQSQLDSVPSQIDAAKEQAKIDVKAELKAAYDAQQVAELQGETGFGDLLK